MIELAPHHKKGLPIPGPVMTAAGALGYGPEYRDIINFWRSDASPLLGAIVSSPVSLKPRYVAHPPRMGVRGAQLIIHTGLPNPGLRAVLRMYRDAGMIGPHRRGFWARQPIPLILHLIATTPDEMARSCEQVSRVWGVAGIEMGLDDGTSVDGALVLLEAALASSDLPIIVRVPFDDVDVLAPALAEGGVDALTLAAPPRGLLPTAILSSDYGHQDKVWVRGRIYGPAVLPLLLARLARWAEKLPVPVIACGGIAAPEDAQACLELGAVAVQVDALVWRDPALLECVADQLMERSN